MKRFVSGALLGLVVCLATGCEESPAPPSPRMATPADAFTRLAADHVRVQVRWMPEMTVFARLPLPQNRLPAIAPQAVALRLAAVRTAAQQAAALPVATLSPAAREALALFLRDRQEELAGARFPEELLPLSAADGGFALWATTALGRGEVLPETAADHEAWLQVLQQVPAWVEAALVNLDQLEARGLALAPEAWRSLAAQVARAAAAELVPPAGAWGSLPAATQQTLARRYAALAQEQLRPALARLQQRLELAASRARGTPVWADLPLGETWYAYRLRRATGLSLTPQQWHDAALAEMARLETLQAAPVAPTPSAEGAASGGEAVLREPLPWAEVPAWQRLVPQVGHRDGYGLYRLRARAELQPAALAEVRDSLALLVIDTGLHGLGWNREQALAYLAAHSRWQGAAALERLGAVLASSAWMAAPAAGGLRLWQLRQGVALQQGAAFDEAAFDAQLGAWGPLPLEVLEARMRNWAATQPALATTVPTAP
jgi:uncharacterized protein (DUF885 family)